MTNNIWSTSVGWSWVVNCDGDMQARKCTKMDSKGFMSQHAHTSLITFGEQWLKIVDY